MKKVFYLLSFVMVFASCTKDDVQENVVEETAVVVDVQQSTALRISLEQIKKSITTTGKYSGPNAVESEDLCFQYEYPIVLSYNNGSEITVADYEQLLQILLDETMALHITGIGFPFDVTMYSDGSMVTVLDDAQFQNIVTNCGYDPVTVSDVVAVTDNCFTVNYPVTVLVNDAPQIFNSQTEAENYFLNNTQSIYSINFEYPLSITMIADNSTVQITNDTDLIYLVNTTCGIN